MGITSRLFPNEVTNRCNTALEPNNTAGSDGLDDVGHFARFLRATKAPAPDKVLAETPKAKRGSKLFDRIGCATCHVRTLTTASAGTKINGGNFTIPEALGQKTLRPFSDFLLHDVGTGDGIVMAMEEHYGPNAYKVTWKSFPLAARQLRAALRTFEKPERRSTAARCADPVERAEQSWRLKVVRARIHFAT